MGTYTIKTLDGNGTISWETGDDAYFDVGTLAVDNDITALGGLSSSTVETAFNSISDVQDGSGSILSVMEAKNFNDSVLKLDANNLQKEYNLLLKNAQKIERAKIKSDIRNTSELLKSNDFLASITNELRLSSEASNILQSEIFSQIEQLNQNIIANTNAIENQNLNPTINQGDIQFTPNLNVNPNVNIDVTPLAVANNKIAEGVQNQIDTNASILNKMDAHTQVLADKQLTLNGDMSANVNIDVTPLVESNNIIASGVQNQIDTNSKILLNYDAMLLMEGVKLTAFQEQTEAIKAQKLISGDTSVHLDVTPLAEANNKIAEGVTNQIETNAKIVENIVKQNENLDFIKNGLPTLKDSKGNVVKPREAKALKSAEDSILSKDKNTFDSEKAIIQPLEKMLLDEKNLDSQTSSGFGDFELKSVLSEILKVDKTKFDFEYRTKLYSNDDPEGAK